ncbi:lipoyl synthase [Clostridium aminobutyricum]|uniref:Lipoyl synthase n=1 Tax=Clostridium aminobutyricum TaxID=33953 RepID=A0A939IH46_CLOAM|nr:lipoyl synthase [Clostridium aminobutyricum]MBN7773112.1 lipoyl synthase [Clostridium aminobutyricum]
MSSILQKPEWLTKKISNINIIEDTAALLTDLSLHTVCDGADCPNRCECYSKKTATFMILGSVCTRQCRFCAVSKGRPGLLDANEPANVGKACRELGLKHVVVTSVTRDDLPDGGAEHFALTVQEIRSQNPSATIELLIPDLNGNWDALKIITDSKPDVLNHNVETVPALYANVRPQANYERSLELIRKVKEFDCKIFTKSGIMVGLGEKEEQVYQVMDDLIKSNCDILTVGQYLQPSSQHISLKEYVHPEKFEEYKWIAETKGFKYVYSGPFVRSSYNASLGLDQINTLNGQIAISIT